MVVWLTGIQYFYASCSQFSVGLPLYVPAKQSMVQHVLQYVCKQYCSQLFRPWCTGYVQKHVAGEVSVTQGSVSGRYPVSIDPPAEEGTRRGLYILIRPSMATVHLRTGELVARCTTHCCCSRRHHAVVAYRSPVAAQYYYRIMDDFVSSGGETALHRPLCLYSREETALYRPLCSVLYSRGGDSSLPYPVFGFM